MTRLRMEFGPLTFLLGYTAGVLSTLSPCVLPLLPILVASATAQHRYGPLALGLGLTFSFTVIGLFVATAGASIGLDQALLRKLGALLLIGFGVLLLSARAQTVFARATGGLGAAGDRLLAHAGGAGWRGQLGVGALLGLVWSPCVGPTLGAAATLAAQGQQLTRVALLMLLFGLGAATPLVVVGSLSRDALARLRGRLLRTGTLGRRGLGLLMLAIGLSIFTGLDRGIEAWTVDHSPGWLTTLTTRF